MLIVISALFIARIMTFLNFLLYRRGIMLISAINGILVVFFSHWNSVFAGSLYCLSCTSTISPRHCHTVRRCDKDEACFVRKYANINGEVRYDTGCYDYSLCQSKRAEMKQTRTGSLDPHTDQAQCLECCSHDACNNQGCGTPGYPVARGPLCFNCPQSLDPTLCESAIVCGSDQVCHIHEESEFGDTFFVSSCVHKYACPGYGEVPNGVIVVGKRAANKCSRCCASDLCNYACDVTSKVDSTTTTTTTPTTTTTTEATTTSPIPPLVAFYVTQSRYLYSGVIRFDKVVTNIGNGYDVSTGTFTAPSAGTYIFSWSAATDRELMNSALEVNDVQKGFVSADEDLNYYDTGTSFAVVELHPSDKVHIRVNKSLSASNLTSFSGWMYNNTDHRAAFYASLSHSGTSSYHFDLITTNQNQAYNPKTGTYTVPRPGLYVFTCSVIVKGSVSGNINIRANGGSNIGVYVSSIKNKTDSVAGMTVMFLKRGDSIQVAGTRAEKYSMFAGWMLAPGNSSSLSNYPAFLARNKYTTSSSPVVFGQTDLSRNPQHGYSTSTGIFTADRNGVYVFFWNIEADHQLTLTSLVVNSVEKGRTRSDGRNLNYDDSSTTAVLQLSKNDQVWINVTSGSVDDGAESLFCGWLLFEY